jgi:SAM-dependent methyltransferase
MMAAMVRNVLESLVVKARDLVYDARHRVRTRGVVTIARLGLTHESVQYEGIAPKTLRKAVAALAPVHAYTFVDLGSGMGRAVLVASEFPFRRIVGVEIATELHEIACRNLRRYRGRQQCRAIDLVRMDALDYEPENKDTVFFLYFPFRESVMTRVVDNIARWLHKHSRHAFLVFVNPETAHVVDRSPAFEPFITDKYFRVWRSVLRANPDATEQ